MRVITGTARGRRLVTLDGDDVRPTTDKVKESLFNIIQFDIEGSNFLDLFTGSGQIGIEAISRGARSATFVDKSKKSIEVAKKNISTCNFTSSASVVQSDSIGFLQKRAFASKNSKFDIAFLDPPYKTGLLQKALESISALMNENGIVLCESPSDEELPDVLQKTEGQSFEFSKEREYIYGKMKLTKYTVSDIEEL